MRARRFELRLIGIALTTAWAVAAALVLVAYRPGGPLDVLVGVTMLAPIAIASGSIAWPPVARGARAFRLMVSLGIGSLLLLVPSIGGVLNQIQALGSQTLMPSLEAAYPWLLALIGTCLFSAFGLIRQRAGATALRRRRFSRGVLVAAVLTLVSGSLFAATAVANELALQHSEAVVTTSRFGPVLKDGEPPDCGGRLSTGRAARITLDLHGEVDGRPLGSAQLTGLRSRTDFRWLADVVTDRQLGQIGTARLGDRAWVRAAGRGWTAVAPASVDSASLDIQATWVALTAAYRSTAEDRGVELIEEARARHCRVAIDGATFRAAFPQVAWLVGDADMARWFGGLDYWIFMDGEVGQIAGSVNGEAAGIRAKAVQATVAVLLTATERGRELVIYPPAR